MTTTLGLTFLLGGAMIATVVVLSLGLLTLFKKGKEADVRSNKMMQLRILFQAIAIALFSLLLFFKGK